MKKWRLIIINLLLVLIVFNLVACINIENQETEFQEDFLRGLYVDVLPAEGFASISPLGLQDSNANFFMTKITSAPDCPKVIKSTEGGEYMHVLNLDYSELPLDTTLNIDAEITVSRNFEGYLLIHKIYQKHTGEIYYDEIIIQNVSFWISGNSGSVSATIITQHMTRNKIVDNELVKESYSCQLKLNFNIID